MFGRSSLLLTLGAPVCASLLRREIASPAPAVLLGIVGLRVPGPRTLALLPVSVALEVGFQAGSVACFRGEPCSLDSYPPAAMGGKGSSRQQMFLCTTDWILFSPWVARDYALGVYR